MTRMQALVQKNVLIRAPSFGCVEDRNIYHVENYDDIVKCLRSAGILGPTSLRASVSSLHLARAYKNVLRLKLKKLDSKDMVTAEIRYEKTEATLGGIAYNIAFDLISLCDAISPYMSIRGRIAVPRPDKFSQMLFRGSTRKSINLVYGCRDPINIVSAGRPLPSSENDSHYEPRICIVTSYPRSEFALESEQIRRYAKRCRDMRTYVCPGSTQISMGSEEVLGQLPRCELVAMQLSEAIQFFQTRTGSASAVLRRIRKRMGRYGIRYAMLTDAGSGAYMITPKSITRRPAYPLTTMCELINRSDNSIPGKRTRRTVSIDFPENKEANFSGCGDAAFAAFVYFHELHRPRLSLKMKLELAMAYAAAVALCRASHLRSYPSSVVRRIYDVVIKHGAGP